LSLTGHVTPLYKDLIARHIFVSTPKEVSFPHNKFYQLHVYLKSFDLGIDIGGEKACILLYADDITLLDNTENDLRYKF
jgi:hypothetical protein